MEHIQNIYDRQFNPIRLEIWSTTNLNKVNTVFSSSRNHLFSWCDSRESNIDKSAYNNKLLITINKS